MTDERTTEEIAAHLRWTDEHLDADTMDGLSAVNILRDALELARRLEQAEEDLLRCQLYHVYNPEGVEIWLQDARNKGQTLAEQLQRVEQLLTGAIG